MLSEPQGIYRQRHPERTPLYAIISENLETFPAEYEHQFFERFGPLTDEARRTLRAYTECGLLEYGFARIRCEACRHEYLLGFSCQLRGVCPSCGGKRVEQWSRFVIDDMLEDVPHRQFVFVIPRHLRRIFMHDRKMMGLLCRAMKNSLFEFYSVGLGRTSAKPGTICFIQRFGDRVNSHVHLHVLCTDGAFDEEGFHRLPLDPEDIEYLERLFARHLLNDLVAAKSQRRKLQAPPHQRHGHAVVAGLS